MPLPRFAAKRDKSEREIVDAFAKLGWSVLRISDKGAPDLLVARDHHLALVECKTGKGTLTADQVKFHNDWKGPRPLIFRTADDVLGFHKAVIGG